MKFPKLSQRNILIGIVIAACVYLFLNSREGFATRLMWQYNPHSKNQSYDIRGDQKIGKTDVGKFFQSSYENNYLNTEN